jgi:hypothetical protein
MAEENPLAGYSDDGLVAEAWQHQARQGVFGIEMSRRLKIAIAEQSRAAEKLGNKIWWLNFWLLVATVAILVLTGVLVWHALRWPGR